VRCDWQPVADAAAAVRAFLRERWLPLASMAGVLVLALYLGALPSPPNLLLSPSVRDVGSTLDGSAEKALRLRSDAEKDARTGLLQVGGGVLVALTLLLTYRRTVLFDKQVRVAEEGHFTERFTRAVEQLGAVNENGTPKLEVRLGGIYALERLAKDSLQGNKKDYWPIIEILTAYVRTNAPAPPEELVADASKTPTGTAVPKPRVDVQAVLTVLGRRGGKFEREESQRLDLSRTELHGVDLHEARLEGADFTAASLWRADLSGAHLEDAVLCQARLKRADLSRACLKDARLLESLLNDANLRAACLERARLWRAHLRGADLEDATLENLSGARDADFRGARGLTPEQKVYLKSLGAIVDDDDPPSPPSET
ncbi:MAG: pentapeptide repeat-containing protein, partial [Candidatus Methylomirabilis sp.]|nr:pentapeptide repeat-containing protein [Deltaproteobacteria bacterium]